MVDVPCSRCGIRLRGQPHAGQCPECGMENAVSLRVAVYRCDDPGDLERVKAGMDAQAWGTILPLLACVLGPMVIRGIVSYEAFGAIVAITLSALAAACLTSSSAARRRGPMRALS